MPQHSHRKCPPGVDQHAFQFESIASGRAIRPVFSRICFYSFSLWTVHVRLQVEAVSIRQVRRIGPPTCVFVFAEDSDEHIGIGSSTADIARKHVYFIVHFYKTEQTDVVSARASTASN